MNPVDRVKRRLDGGRRWVKGVAVSQGKVCLGAATTICCKIRVETEVRYLLSEAIRAEYPDRVPGPLAGSDAVIVSFNDARSTKWDDVERVLEKTSARWDELHGGRS